jgi:hypothetical protein
MADQGDLIRHFFCKTQGTIPIVHPMRANNTPPSATTKSNPEETMACVSLRREPRAARVSTFSEIIFIAFPSRWDITGPPEFRGIHLSNEVIR